MLRVYRLLQFYGLLGIFISFIFVAQLASCNSDDQAHGPANLESSEGILKHDDNSSAPDCSQGKEDRPKGRYHLLPHFQIDSCLLNGNTVNRRIQECCSNVINDQ